jgi:hypothetical protein
MNIGTSSFNADGVNLSPSVLCNRSKRLTNASIQSVVCCNHSSKSFSLGWASVRHQID